MSTLTSCQHYTPELVEILQTHHSSDAGKLIVDYESVSTAAESMKPSDIFEGTHEETHSTTLFGFVKSTLFVSSTSLQESVGVLSVHFVMPWFLTLFTSLPCWDSVLAVWDLIILHGMYTQKHAYMMLHTDTKLETCHITIVFVHIHSVGEGNVFHSF